ncbi:MAG: GNAT family N-acetyltransferase [Bacteroidetes bacterium]|nr:GNAT family N-acetyltransferase [Bacteroidota bacterium]
MACVKIELATTHSQLYAIAQIAAEIWNEHYSPIIGKAQVDYMIEKFQSIEAMQKQIEEGYAYYLFFKDEELIGYLGIQPRETHLFLSKVYLLKQHRSKGFGKQALEFVSKRALDLGLNVIQLTVNKYNTNSIKTYQKAGFKTIKPAVFDIGNGFVMDDFVMEKVV